MRTSPHHCRSRSSNFKSSRNQLLFLVLLIFFILFFTTTITVTFPLLFSFAHEGDMAKVKLWIDGNRHRRFFNAMLNAQDRLGVWLKLLKGFHVVGCCKVPLIAPFSNGCTPLIIAATEVSARIIPPLPP